MAYREDKDLKFLSGIDSKDLDDLVYCLTHDKDGKSRWTEELTKTEKYKNFYPHHQKYWQEIAAEIQCFGANTFATLVRGGKGVLYEEILRDVAGKLRVKFSKSDSVLELEQKVLLKLLSKTLDDMSEEDRKSFAYEFNITDLASYSPEALLTAFQIIFRAGGFQSYKLTLIISNAVMKAIFGRGLTFAGNAALTRTASIITGPIGWTVLALWTTVDIAGPAYRVTIPAVVQIALLRWQDELKKRKLWDEIEKELGSR